ncbi:energy transducer TonB [Shewanella glacialimarina]|jgi:TonB family protein|uniref:energy transducer TonB n=1 Tax=Shewanella glacialimarina TaxID=2590884 RepID=UPI001CF816D6|nr:energy transducer TonB [Shewanella glacialimarina]UCX04477.1 energy transducer TonB [Shewanella glacialimarina]
MKYTPFQFNSNIIAAKIRMCVYGSLLVASIVSPMVQAADFSSSYQAYQQAVASKDVEQTLVYAQQAYDFGKVSFGENHIDTAMLLMNLANAQRDSGDNVSASQNYDNVLASYITHYGNNSIEVLDPMLLVAESTTNDKKAQALFEDTIGVAKSLKDPLVLAEVYTAAFKHLYKTSKYNHTIKNYGLKAYDIYSQHLPEDAIVRVDATHLAASIQFAEKHYDTAKRLFLEVIKQYQALDYSHPSELHAHAVLVELYEKQNNSQQATAHCIAIGKMKPWSDDQDQVPLFRHHPNYPKSYAKDRKEGWVDMAFIIDKNGFVKSASVLDSKGGKRFEIESLEAIQKWRYAPKFVDGNPVQAEAKVRLDFTIANS